MRPVDVHFPERSNKLKSTRACGWADNFIAYDSASAEDLWNSVESRAPAAFKAVDADTPFADPLHVETLRDLIVLHYVRSHRYRDVYTNAFETVRAKVPSELVERFPEALRREALRQTGLHLAGADALIPAGAGSSAAPGTRPTRPRDHPHRRGAALGRRHIVHHPHLRCDHLGQPLGDPPPHRQRIPRRLVHELLQDLHVPVRQTLGHRLDRLPPPPRSRSTSPSLIPGRCPPPGDITQSNEALLAVAVRLSENPGLQGAVPGVRPPCELRGSAPCRGTSQSRHTHSLGSMHPHTHS